MMKHYNPSSNKIGLIITPLFGSSQPFQKTLYVLKDYHLLIPSLWGTEHGTTFTSIEEEAARIHTYLWDHQVTHLDFILGFSLGANIALELYSRGNYVVRKIILDGTVVQNHSKLIQKMIQLKFKSIRKDFIEDKFCKKIIENYYPHCYEDIKSLLRSIDETTVRNAISSACSYQFPNLDILQDQLFFLYGENDPSSAGISQLYEKYAQAKFLKLRHLQHCAYLLQDPDNFLSLLR